MENILITILFLIILTVFMIIAVYYILRKDSDTVALSKYILNKFEPDNTAPKITELIEFHKENKELNKYNVG